MYKKMVYLGMCLLCVSLIAAISDDDIYTQAQLDGVNCSTVDLDYHYLGWAYDRPLYPTIAYFSFSYRTVLQISYGAENYYQVKRKYVYKGVRLQPIIDCMARENNATLCKNDYVVGKMRRFILPKLQDVRDLVCEYQTHDADPLGGGDYSGLS